jgi:hypothetical protein
MVLSLDFGREQITWPMRKKSPFPQHQTTVRMKPAQNQLSIAGNRKLHHNENRRKSSLLKDHAGMAA